MDTENTLIEELNRRNSEAREFVECFETYTGREAFCAYFAEEKGTLNSWTKAKTAINRISSKAIERYTRYYQFSPINQFYEVNTIVSLTPMKEVVMQSKSTKGVPWKVQQQSKKEIFGFKVDLDKLEGITSLEECAIYVWKKGFKPSFIVQTSPSSFHVVFLFKRSHRKLKSVIQSIIKSTASNLGGDSRCKGISPFNFRLPGSVNTKNGFVVNVLWTISSPDSLLTEDDFEVELIEKEDVTETEEEFVGDWVGYRGELPEELLKLSTKGNIPWRRFLRYVIAVPRLKYSAQLSTVQIAKRIGSNPQKIHTLIKRLIKRGYLTCEDSDYAPRQKAMAYKAHGTLLQLHNEYYTKRTLKKFRRFSKPESAIDFLNLERPLEPGTSFENFPAWVRLLQRQFNLKDSEFIRIVMDNSSARATEDEYKSRLKALKKSYSPNF